MTATVVPDHPSDRDYSPSTTSLERTSVSGVDRSGARRAPRVREEAVPQHSRRIAEMPHRRLQALPLRKDLSMYGLEDYTRNEHVMLYHGFER